MNQIPKLAYDVPGDVLGTNQVAMNGSTATLIVAARPGRSKVIVTMLGAVDVYLGTSAVLTSTGDLLLGTKGTQKTLDTSAAIYGIAASGTPSVSYSEFYCVGNTTT